MSEGPIQKDETAADASRSFPVGRHEKRRRCLLSTTVHPPDKGSSSLSPRHRSGPADVRAEDGACSNPKSGCGSDAGAAASVQT